MNAARKEAAMRTMRIITPMAMGLAFAVGCSDDSSYAATIDAAQELEPDTVVLTLNLPGSSAEGFKFCNTDAKELGCATSDADGQVTIAVPANSDVALTVDREGYVPLLFQRHMGDEDATESLLAFPSDSLRSEGEKALGFELESGKGVAVVNVTGGVGGTVSVRPPGARTYYWQGWIPRPDATTIQVAAAAYYNLDPGMYEFAVEAPNKDCRVDPASWAGDAPNVVRARVEADRWSWFLIVNCVAAAP
jgi:hypothetical protein